MKYCRTCREEFSDKVTKCLYCGGPVEVIFAPGEKSIETPASEKSSEPQSLWTNSKTILIAAVVLLLVIGFAASRWSNLKSSEEPTLPLERPDFESPTFSTPFQEDVPETAPPPEPAEMPKTASEDAFRLMQDAYALCSGGKCTNPEQAIAYLDEAIRLKPDIAEAYNNRGNAYADLKQYERAIEDYHQAIRLKPSYAHAYYNRALAYSDLGQHQQAIDDYNEVLRLKPQEVNAYHNRGKAYLLLGNPELGCQDAQRACDLGNCSLLEKARKKKECP